MTDARSSPMLPLRWADPPGGRTDQGVEFGHEEHDAFGGDVLVDGGTPAVGVGGFAPTASDGAAGRPEVVVRTSTRRRKTAAAFWESGRIVVVMPTHVPRSDRPELVEWLVARVMAKRPGTTATDDVLAARAAALADRYLDGVRPASIRWVTNQGKRWGSCSIQTGEIRLSHRLRVVPDWVLDATIVHELAHLVHADHSAAFHSLADRHPRQHDALVFLEGYSLGLQTSPDP